MYPDEINQYLDVIKRDKSKNTLSVYKGAIDKLFSFIGETELNKLNSQKMREFQSHLQKSMANTSVNTNIRPLRAMFNWLVDNEYLKKSPLEKVKDLTVGKRLVAFLSEEEQSSLISACTNICDKTIVALLLSTGLRREELCSLTVKNYNGTHIQVIGKGDKERKLALQPSVIELLNNYLIERNKKYGNKTDALLVTRLGGHYTGSAIYKKIKELFKDAGIAPERIKKLRVHSCRHSFVANMLDSGADIFVCQNALGHASINTTMKYAHLHSRTLDKAMQNQKSVL